MATSDLIAGLLLLALSAAMFAATFSFPKLTVALSPTVFPRFVTVGLFLLSALLLLQSLTRRRGVRRPRDRPRPQSAARRFPLRFLLLAGSGLLYALLLQPAGYLLATPPFLAAAMLLFGERRWLRLVLVPLAGTALLFAVFRLVFRVPLPRSPLY